MRHDPLPGGEIAVVVGLSAFVLGSRKIIDSFDRRNLNLG
jgi:hypothetical protein